MVNKYPFLSSLPDEELVSIYAEAAKSLKDRGLLATTKRELRRITSSKKPQVFNTPLEFNRGKVKRMASHSILLDFISEDWSSLFDKHGLCESKCFYVYYHTDPTLANMRFRKGDKHVDFVGRPFYVGKGTGDRFRSKKRGRDHLSVIKSLTESRGIAEDRIFHIFRDGLTEIEALELEAKLITFFGCQSELSRSKAHFHGIKGGLLVNSDIARRPMCVEAMIKVKGGL